MPPLPTLDVIEAAVWRELQAAATDRSHGWRHPVLATVTADGAPDARVVVLREVNAAERRLLFFTDARSPKAAQLNARPEGLFVMWSPPLGWQLRVRATLQLQVDGLAVSSRWARLKLSPAAQDYLAPLPPGSALPEMPCPTTREDDRGHFAVVTAQLEAIDWLALSPQGHRRAAFDAQGARWLQP